MNATDDDARAIRSQLGRLQTLAEAAACAADTENMSRALWALSVATTDARALVKAVEDHTRTAAMERAQ